MTNSITVSLPTPNSSNLTQSSSRPGLRGKSAAHFLDGPRFFAARGLPEQLSGFLGAALGDERLVEGFVEACAGRRLVGWIDGLARAPFRGFITGNARLELRISLHNAGLLYWVCSVLC